MAVKKRGTQETEAVTVSFTVAECGEFHSLGEYHGDIRTAEEAAAIYRNIPPGRMHGIPAIGIKIHRKGRPAYEDEQADVVSGGEVDTILLQCEPEVWNYPLVWEAVEALKRLFPESEAAGF